MSFRRFLQALESTRGLLTIARQVDPNLEMAALIHALGERPVLFERVTGSDYPVVAGLCSRRDLVATGLGMAQEHLLSALGQALHHPIAPPMATAAPCQEVVEEEVNLYRLPILTHLGADGGAYVSAGVAVVKDPEFGRNLSFHRLLRLDDRHFAIRLVEGRGTHAAWQKAGGELEIAICIGNAPAVLLAAATSPAPGVDELAVANALDPTPLAKCRTVDLEVPAEAEIVLEGRITRECVGEGPFLDLTETMDLVRLQPMVEIWCVTHRRSAFYQALLPGGLEHKLLMGMPREPTIYDQVSQVCDCLSVLLTPGGGSWLHAVVQIHKRHPDDGARAMEAAFRGHASLKHVLVVDDDVNVYDPAELEWSIATRVQADASVVVWPNQSGSSLDPSALHVPGIKSRTSKVGVDATIPWRKPSGELRTEAERHAFRKVRYPALAVDDYVVERNEHA
jgi:2,5-furandicarboxylate decarboxylase 1